MLVCSCFDRAVVAADESVCPGLDFEGVGHQVEVDGQAKGDDELRDVDHLGFAEMVCEVAVLGVEEGAGDRWGAIEQKK